MKVFVIGTGLIGGSMALDIKTIYDEATIFGIDSNENNLQEAIRLGIIDERNSMSLKMHGMHGTAYANYAIQDSDLIIGIGNRFDDRTTGLISKYAPRCKKIIYVDNDLKRLKKIEKQLPHKVISIHSDSKSFIKLISGKVDNRIKYDWINKITDLKKDYPLKEESGMAVSKVILELSKLLEYRTNFVMTTGVGNHQMKLAQYMTWTKPKQMISSGSQGTMGVALPFAIGAYYDNPNNDIFCFDGDGSFMMSAVELATIKEYNIPIKIIIINDNSLQMVNMWQEIYYKKCELGNSLKNPSFKKMAKGFGIKSISCSSPLTIKRALNIVINSKEPILCEFNVNKSWCLPFVGPGKGLNEMIL
jgi:acetolactate synthase-1/2/3 large subunit